jgi:transcriptional regulator with XRE-family HTH domain
MNELEQRWRDLGEFIREQRRVDRLSLRKLSEMAGVSNPYLSQIERGLRKPSAEILQQIARALQISAESLYVRAGILDETDLEQDLVAVIRRDPHVDEDQKKTLIHIYESFAAEHAGRLVMAPPSAPGSADPVTADPADGNPADGNPVDGNPVDGNPVDGEAAEAEVTGVAGPVDEAESLAEAQR